MHSKYLKCDECGAVIDKRPTDDHSGRYRETAARGAYAPGEERELLEYAKSIGWRVDGGKHICPKHAGLEQGRGPT